MKTNKGFSLVELIIVIAIMAILVGVMAPQLIKWIEKTKISADVQLCDSIHTAMYTAMADPAVFDDPQSVTLIGYYTMPNAGGALKNAAGYSSCAYYKEVVHTLGFDPFAADANKYLQSKPAATSGVISILINSSGSDFSIYVEHSDRSGEGQDYTGSANIDKMICAPEYNK